MRKVKIVQKILAILLLTIVLTCSLPALVQTVLGATSHTITLVGIAGIHPDAAAILEDLGFVIDGDTATIQKTEDDSLTIPTIWKDGYRFEEWEEYGDMEVELDIGDINQDMTFTAIFSEPSILTLSGLDGVTATTINKLTQIGFTVKNGIATKKYYETDFPFNLPSVSKENYSFLGWYESDGSSEDAALTVTFNPQNATKTAYTASFKAIDYTITLSGLSGIDDDSKVALAEAGFSFNELAPGIATAAKNIEDSLSIPAIHKNGFRFKEWDDDNTDTTNGKTITLAAGDISKDVSYAAIFQEEFTLTLSGLQGIDSGSVNALENAGFTIGNNSATMIFTEEDGKVNLPVIAKDGYEFRGWYIGDNLESASLDVEFDPSVSIDTEYKASFVKFYTITYKHNGTEITSLKSQYYTGADSITLPSLPTRANYTGDGWTLQGSSTVHSVGTLALADINIESTSSEKDLVFNAHYTATPYTITIRGLAGISENSIIALKELGFSLDDENSPTAATISKTVEDSLTIPALAKDGFRFVKWSDSNTDTEDSKTITLTVGDITNDLSYEAIFQQEYTLVLLGINGVTSVAATAIEDAGFVISDDQAVLTFVDTDNKIAIPDIAKEGYEFLGYYAGTDAANATTNIVFDPSIAANTTYTAKFQRVYKIAFNTNGGTVAETITVADGKIPTLPISTREEFNLIGWFYADDTEAKEGDAINADITLFAKWEPVAKAVTEVNLSTSKLELYQKQTFDLVATVIPEDASDKSVVWASSNPNIATVDAGTIEAINEGVCTITVTSTADETKFATCEVIIFASEIIDRDENGKIIDPGGKAIDENGQARIWIGGLNTIGYYYTGRTIKPVIHVYKGYRLLHEGVDYTLSYKNNTKVSTKITKDSSKPQIIIKMKDRHSGSKIIYFNILPTPVEKLMVKDSNLEVFYKAKKKNQLKPTLEYGDIDIKYNKNDLSFKWFETDEIGNATDVESDCIDPGSYAIKVYAGSSGNFTGTEGLQVATVNVLGKIPISAVKVKGFKSKVPYNNGAAIEQPEMTLTYKSGKTLRTLILGEDYTVSYDNNYNVGTATVTYEGMKDSSGNYTGDFAGKITKKYQITGKYTLDSSNATVALAEDSYEFQNAAIEPAVTVTVTAMDDNGNPENRTLVNGKDYTVTYKNNKAVAAKDAVNSKGKDIAPQVIIKGKGNYATSKQGMVERFNITKTELSSLVLTISDKPYSNKAGGYKSPKIVFTDKNYRDLKLKAGKDYTIDYATSDGSETPAPGQTVDVTITAKEASSYTGSVTGSYRITSSIYTDVNKAKVVVNPNTKGKTTACIYTGSEITPGQPGQPNLIITTGSGKKLKTLTQGIDYEIVSYHNNVNPSKSAYVIVRGLGDYRGVRAIKFTISARPISTCWGGIFGRN